jgi:hypothetical protein
VSRPLVRPKSLRRIAQVAFLVNTSAPSPIMDGASPPEHRSGSPALLAANQQLYELRQALGCRPEIGRRRGLEPAAPASTVSLPADELAWLPDHLGWGSSVLTQALRAAGVYGEGQPESRVKQRAAPGSSVDNVSPQAEQLPPPEAAAQLEQLPQPDSVKLYPDIALGMLQAGQAGAGRIWLLLRHLDVDGQGWLALDVVRQQLTGRHSATRVCGWRQLRNLLCQGEGIYWKRETVPDHRSGLTSGHGPTSGRGKRSARGRIWLKSAAKVAVALDVERLSRRPVALPVQVLLDGIGQVRAHFYASFHSGRRSNNPISRATLERITHVPERTQRSYEKTAGVAGRRNIAVGRRYSAKEVQERAWRHGRATFEFVDRNGEQGPAGKQYVAWRLPNSYLGCHEPSPTGRQKKINQQIDLVNSGAQGNDLCLSDAQVHRSPATSDRSLLFHPSGLEAGKAYNRDHSVDAYWPALGLGGGSRRPAGVTAQTAYGLWAVLPSQEQPGSGRP